MQDTHMMFNAFDGINNQYQQAHINNVSYPNFNQQQQQLQQQKPVISIQAESAEENFNKIGQQGLQKFQQRFDALNFDSVNSSDYSRGDKSDDQEDSGIYSPAEIDSVLKKRGKYKTFTDEERSEIITYMLTNGIDMAMKQYGCKGNGITRKKLRCWLKNHDREKKAKGRKTTDATRDYNLHKWCLNFSKQGGRMPTRKEFTSMALKLSNDTEFKASKGWLDKFSKRHRLDFTPSKNVIGAPSSKLFDADVLLECSSINDSFDNTSFHSLPSPGMKDYQSDDCNSPNLSKRLGDLYLESSDCHNLSADQIHHSPSQGSPDSFENNEKGIHNRQHRSNSVVVCNQTPNPGSCNQLQSTKKPSLFARRNNRHMTTNAIQQTCSDQQTRFDFDEKKINSLNNFAQVDTHQAICDDGTMSYQQVPTLNQQICSEADTFLDLNTNNQNDNNNDYNTFNSNNDNNFGNQSQQQPKEFTPRYDQRQLEDILNFDMAYQSQNIANNDMYAMNNFNMSGNFYH